MNDDRCKCVLYPNKEAEERAKAFREGLEMIHIDGLQHYITTHPDYFAEIEERFGKLTERKEPGIRAGTYEGSYEHETYGTTYLQVIVDPDYDKRLGKFHTRMLGTQDFEFD